MMLLSTLVLSLLGPAIATPLPGHTVSPTANLPGGSRLSDVQARDLAHLAGVVNDAYCDGISHPAVLAGSHPNDVLDSPAWQITRDQASDTLYLAITSPASEDLVEILASALPDGDHLSPLPSTFLLDSLRKASMYTPYLPYLTIVEEATEALYQQIALASSPAPLGRLWTNVALALGLPCSHYSSTPSVEIIGHGLGSVLALLATISLHINHPDLRIRSTLFSMPKLGDEGSAFAMDALLGQAGSELDVRRITYGEGIMPALPPKHYGLIHPLSIQHTRLAHEKGGQARDNAKMKDGHGPYAGQMIGWEC